MDNVVTHFSIEDVRLLADNVVTILETVKSHFETVKVVNASDIAVKAGNIRTANTVMLGVLSAYLDTIGVDTWENVLRKSFPEKVTKINLTAFDLGRKA